MTAADWTTIGQPQDIRLVVADMDGTLLDERSRIPDGFWPMLARLKRRGVEFVPASGRQYATLRNMFADKAAEILDGGELSYIAENGNVVALDGKVVEVHGVDLDVTRHVIDLVADAAASGEHNVGLVVCGLKSAYVQRSDEPFLDEVGKYYAALSIVDDLHEVLEGRQCALVGAHVRSGIEGGIEGHVGANLAARQRGQGFAQLDTGGEVHI